MGVIMAMKVRYTVMNGEILSENRNGAERDYVPDLLGSTVALLDNTQTQTDTFTYWPYGQEKSRTGTTATPFRFLGTLGYYRDSSNKSYVRARVLDTANGKWMTQDPIGLFGGGNTLYGYVSNNPTNRVDPSGLLADAPVTAPIIIGLCTIGEGATVTNPVGVTIGCVVVCYLGVLYAICIPTGNLNPTRPAHPGCHHDSPQPQPKCNPYERPCPPWERPSPLPRPEIPAPA